MTRGNPRWTRDEVVLALDLYFDLTKPIKRKDPRILGLSRDFQRIAAEKGVQGGPNLRNPTSIYFKMNNFLELDPAYKGTGFHNYSDLDEKAWNDFVGNREALKDEARQIRSRLLNEPVSNGTGPALTQEVLEAWDEVIRRNDERIPADKAGPFSIAALRGRLRPIRDELRDAMAMQLPDHPRLAGLKSYTANFWQAGRKGARLKGYIWNFLAPDHAKTRARLQATFTIERTVRAEYVSYPAIDGKLRYDISRISAALRSDSTFKNFRAATATLPRGFFLSCKTGSGNTVDEFLDEMPESSWEDLRASGLSLGDYFVIGVDRPRERLLHLTVGQLAELLLADLSDLGAARELFDGKTQDAPAPAVERNPLIDRTRRASAPAPKGVYRPEFSGTKTYIPPKSPVEADCHHGLVVDALALVMSSRNIAHGNDQFRDLYILGENGSLKMLFEVKTDLGTSSIYSAVGQLMLHGAGEDRQPVLVAVLPGKPDGRTARALERLGINLLAYEMAGIVVSFPELDAFLTRLLD